MKDKIMKAGDFKLFQIAFKLDYCKNNYWKIIAWFAFHYTLINTLIYKIFLN